MKHCLENRKTANIIQKMQFNTMLTVILHCYTHRKQKKMIKVILLTALWYSVKVL